MPKQPKKTTNGRPNGGANLGFESTLWAAADKMRNNMDAAEYKHVVLGLIFLKYISDAFEEKRAVLIGQKSEGADPEDPDEYRADNIFWVPKEARWTHLLGHAVLCYCPAVHLQHVLRCLAAKHVQPNDVTGIVIQKADEIGILAPQPEGEYVALPHLVGGGP